MKRSSIIEARRQHVDPEVRQKVELSFQIVDRIHEILVAKGLKQKDLAQQLGKKEAEISKWMRGTHNFTIDTLVSIERPLMHLSCKSCIRKKSMHKKKERKPRSFPSSLHAYTVCCVKRSQDGCDH